MSNRTTILGSILGHTSTRLRGLEAKTVLVSGTDAYISASSAAAGTIRFATDSGRLMVSTGSAWVGTGVSTALASAISSSSLLGSVVNSAAGSASAISSSSLLGSIVNSAAGSASATSSSSLLGSVMTAALQGHAHGLMSSEGLAVGSSAVALQGHAHGLMSSEGLAAGSTPVTQSDVISLSPSLFHRSEDIADSDSDGYANTWVEYGGGTQYEQDAWGTSHPYYISSDSEFNNHPVVDFSGNHYMNLRTSGSSGNSAQHYFMIFGWADSSNWNANGYIHGNPWGTANQLKIDSMGQQNFGSWASYVGLGTATASNWNNSTNTIRKNGQTLSAAQQLNTPLMNIRDTSGNTLILSANGQSVSTNSSTDWTLPVLYEWESNGTKTFNPRWFGKYSSGLVVPIKVAEIVGFSSALSSSDAATVRSYLGGRYNIQMT